VGFDVENIEPMDWPTAETEPMNTLILDESDKDVIIALARKFSRGRSAWGADYMEGKGEGQIFLLHGCLSLSKPLTRKLLTVLRRTTWHR
jgi:hypothetical protein